MNINKIKKLSAIMAIVFGILFTLTTLLSIWGAPRCYGDCYFGSEMITIKLMPTFALLTASFMVLLVIIRIMEDKKP